MLLCFFDLSPSNIYRKSADTWSSREVVVLIVAPLIKVLVDNGIYRIKVNFDNAMKHWKKFRQQINKSIHFNRREIFWMFCLFWNVTSKEIFIFLIPIIKRWPLEKSALSAICFASGFGGKSGFVSMVRLVLNRYNMGVLPEKLKKLKLSMTVECSIFSKKIFKI